MEKVKIELLRIERSIRLIRGDKVILDEDLAELYGVETKNLVKAVKRNLDRFPADFMFQLTNQEFSDLRFQSGTSSQWGGRRTPPYAFSEQGVAMLSSVLHSPRVRPSISESVSMSVANPIRLRWDCPPANFSKNSASAQPEGFRLFFAKLEQLEQQ